jgi:queuine tRNA-ribosyltransferase
VRALGYELVLGNTFHLLLAPGPELVQEMGGLHGFMRWPGPIITDSGGFQVFSMGHGTVADEIKGRRGARGKARSAQQTGRSAHQTGRSAQQTGGSAQQTGRSAQQTGRSAQQTGGALLAIEEEGVRFRSYVDGQERFLGPESSMAVQAALGSDVALTFDECTPYHATRDYTARSTERTHRWLQRCLRWHADNGPPEQAVYGIVQGGVYDDLRSESAQTVAGAPCAGAAIGGSLGADTLQMREVVAFTVRELARHAPERPRHLLGIGDVEDLVAGVELGIDTFDCAIPTRLGRHGVALVPDPASRWRLDLTKGRYAHSREPILEGCVCPACAGGYSRAYLHYLVRAGELTAVRLLTLHNLNYVARLMDDLRASIKTGTLAQAAAALRSGIPPGQVGAGSHPRQ